MLCHARVCPSSPGPPLPCESGLQLHGGVGSRAGEKSMDALHLPYAGAAGAHPFFFLHQTAITGQPGRCSTERAAQPL